MQKTSITRSGSRGEEEFHTPITSPNLDQDEDPEDEFEDASIEAPAHPVQSMQLAFEESIVESADDNDGPTTSSDSAEVRRQTLLETKKYDESWQKRWKQRSTAKYHPLLKLVSQIVFGLHLLQQQQAKSEGEVVKILQSHVNEVDSFLERTAEDFNLAITDIHERIRHLKLPMEHKDVFEVMLDDKAFRTQLLDGNEKIESIIGRTTTAMEGSLYDLQEGTKANKELGKYLDSVQEEWPSEKRVISDVFNAMRGNEHGWTRYIIDLQSKASTLRQSLMKLGALLGKMSQMAATASRRKVDQGQVVSSGSRSAPTSPGLRSKFRDDNAPPVPSSAWDKDMNKPLPREPPKVGGASKDTTIPHRAPLLQPPPRPRPTQQSFDTSAIKAPRAEGIEPQRPRTAGAMTSRKAREADSRGNTSDLAAFLMQDTARQAGPQHHNPLRSNPPDMMSNNMPGRLQGKDLTSAGRSKSYGAIDIMKGAEQARSQVAMKGRDSSTSTRTSSEPSERAQTLSGTGFARRLSKRMKHLPSQDEVSAEQEKAQQNEQYPDSAYASGPESKSSPPTSSSKQPRNRPDSTLGPLPSKGMEPLYASRVTQAPLPAVVNREAGRDGTNQSVRSLAPTSKSRGSSFKSAFQRKWSSGKKLFAT